METELKEIEKKFSKLEEKLQDPVVIQNKTLYNQAITEFSKLKPLAEGFREYKKLEKDLTEHQNIKEEDPELAALASEEMEKIKNKIENVKKELKLQLKPKDPMDEKNIILELRSGAGGDEAGLFCRELFEAYTRYAQMKNWKVEVLSCSTLSTGGFREVIARMAGSGVSGPGVFGRMKFERGVHRVQRVPETESQGRIHTSTVTTAVLPEAQKKDVEIKSGEVRVDVCRSSGAGGQHVNTTDSAVRIVHLPTKITVYCQEEKSQHANKEKAFKILYAKLLALKKEKERQTESKMRLEQIGGGGRAEKIRTYNFPQSRITDHRGGLAIHALDRFMRGELDLIIEPLLKNEGLK